MPGRLGDRMVLTTLALAAALAGPAPADASRPFDVRLSVRTRCTAGEAGDDCARTITADVLRGVDGAPVQRLRAPFPERVRDVAAGDRLRIADVDFDGHDDIALCSGRDALGGAPSYTFYRYRPAEGRFVADARLGALQSRASGFFVVDRAQRRLRLEAHGGDGRTLTEFAWPVDRPVLVRRTRADALGDGRMRLALGERRHGQWRERHWIVAPDARWPPPFEAAEAALRAGH
jgi:hypothetical protein